MRYFKKTNPKQAFLGSFGQWIKFPDFGNGFGGVATEDPKTIKEFLLTMSKNVGGVEEVTAKEFEDLKKKLPSLKPSSEAQPANLRSLINRRDQPAHQSAAAVGADRTLVLPNREESLLMPSEPAKPTGFRPRSFIR